MIINELTDIRNGDIIHAPDLMKDYVVISYNYDSIRKEMLANLAPIDKNDRGFTISLTTMIALGYRKR